MKIDVRRFFELVGEQQDFEFPLDMSDAEVWGKNPICSPVAVKGSIQNRSSIVTLAYNASVKIQTLCDRCLCEIDRTLDFQFEYTLVKELQDTDLDGYILVEGDILDLSELCYSDVILNLPLKFLCKEDCKGLCEICGKNKNLFDCDCLNSQIDPRLAALKALLKE